MLKDNKIWLAQTDEQLSQTEEKINIFMLPSMANRHGLIAGATGTGKTTTMKVMAESFSDMGVPVFFADIKGDLTGTAFPGKDCEDMQSRIEHFGIASDFEFRGYPCRFWDIFGNLGHPVRVTVSSLGPVLLSRLLNLTDAQTGVLNVVFKIADEHGLLLIDLKDLRSMLSYVGENSKEFNLTYGMVSPASVGAIQRALLAFENEGGDLMFGEPQLDIKDWIRTDASGKGFINILESSRLVRNPLTYSTFLLWMLTNLYEQLPEVGDLEKPRFVFFFDEAHMLFEDAPKALLQKIEQIVKLIRSKGVGVFFVTQSPSDIPDGVLAQLNNKVVHGLRAYTPSEQKKIKAASDAFRVNPAFKTGEKLMELGTGEALVSFLNENGIPETVQAVKILPPQSFMGAADEAELRALITADEFELKYRDCVDRESAYEILEQARAQMLITKTEEKEAKEAEKKARQAAAGTSTAERAASNAASSVARSLSTNIVNSVTGGKTKSVKQITKQAASSALSTVMRKEARTIIRGLFGNSKK